MDIEKWKVKQEDKRPQNYTHFDYRVSLNDCWKYISDPDKVSHHGFYPFIHYEIKSRKIKNGKKAAPKVRNIYYAAHLDGWIYKFYAYRLNELYNSRVVMDGIESVAVAYRTDLEKSNVDFAHEAFNYIKGMSSGHVIIGDFTDFFDTLDHKYLKGQLCDLLQVKALPNDYYAVFKNVTKFSFWELEDLLALNGLEDTVSNRRSFNKLCRALSPAQLRANKAHIKPNPRCSVGVPQGSPISATLANIYMLSVDKSIYDYVSSFGGFYMRYSDDFMIVLPDNEYSSFREHYAWIKKELDLIPSLELQDQKTKIFYVAGNHIESCSHEFIPALENGKNAIDFLGFTFDGTEVSIRDKTLSKYYHRLYRKTKSIANRRKNALNGQHVSCKKLYERYSYKGTIKYQKQQAAKHNEHLGSTRLKGNFLDYVERAQIVFDTEPIKRGTKRHMQRIRRSLNKPTT